MSILDTSGNELGLTYLSAVDGITVRSKMRQLGST